MTHYGTWISYAGTARIVLAVVLMAAAGAVGYAGIRLPLPLWPAGPGKARRPLRIVIWLFAIAAFLVCAAAYVKHALREHLFHAPPADPITPVTLICAGLTFFIIVVATSPRGWRVALGSAVIGAMAAPMIFEFPFDLVVMARTFPPLPPDPALYRVLFFAPLFLVEVTTLWLLPLSPVVRLSRAAFLLFALMLAVFAVWGLTGFAYPATPVPFALNVVSKILAFAVAVSLFLPQQAGRLRATAAGGRADTDFSRCRPAGLTAIVDGARAGQPPGGEEDHHAAVHPTGAGVGPDRRDAPGRQDRGAGS